MTSSVLGGVQFVPESKGHMFTLSNGYVPVPHVLGELPAAVLSPPWRGSNPAKYANVAHQSANHRKGERRTESEREKERKRKREREEEEGTLTAGTAEKKRQTRSGI